MAAIVGYQNVYFSIYENGSKDQTKALLKLFDAIGTVAGRQSHSLSIPASPLASLMLLSVYQYE